MLVLLSNPSNVALLTSQLLSAPTIWSASDHVQTVLQVVDVFTSASIRVLRRQQTSQDPTSSDIQRSLGIDDWTVAVVKGASAASPRSRHVLAFTGLLRGLGVHGRNGMSTGLHTKMQDTLTAATNLSLQESSQRTNVIEPGLIMAVSLVFDTLDRQHKTSLDHDLLLPMLVSTVLFSDDGLRQGYFLSMIDADIVEGAGGKFHWSTDSVSCRQLLSLASIPLVAALGRLSRLAAFSIEQVKDITILARLMQDLHEFSRSLSIQWRQNKLSEIDASEEMMYLSDETLRTPVPLLWRVLRTTMFSVVVILTSCMRRLLNDGFQGGFEGWFFETLIVQY